MSKSIISGAFRTGRRAAKAHVVGSCAPFLNEELEKAENGHYDEPGPTNRPTPRLIAVGLLQ